MVVLVAAVAVLIAALVAVNIAYIRHLERKDARHDAQIGRLLQRIQAPEQAVIEHVGKRSDGPLYVNPERVQQAWLTDLVAAEG